MAEHDVSGEARDERGRWTAGASAPSPAEARQLIGPRASGDAPTFYESKSDGPTYMLDNPDSKDLAEHTAWLASSVADKLDFNPKNIIVTDRERVFELAGAKHNYAGSADLASGRIALYTSHLSGLGESGIRRPIESSVREVTAHEIMHQKFQSFLTEYRNELERMRSDPMYKDQSKDFMKPDGLLKEPYAAQYSAYQEYTSLHANWEKMAKEDGVTAYSQEWWDAAKNGKGVTYEQAYHETLAEMATLHERYGKIEGPPAMKKNGMLTGKTQSKDWIALYKAVNRRWKESREAFRRAG